MIELDIPPDYVVLAASAAAIGLLLGLLLEWLFTRRKLREYENNIRQLEAELRHRDELSAERAAALELATSELKGTFGELANATLRNNNDVFLQLAQQRLGAQQQRADSDLKQREQAVETLVKPIREALKNTERQISELEKARSEAYGTIYSQLETMQKDQQALQTETRNLVNALRRPEVRGQWGEMTLRRLAELAGMVEHCDFFEQEHTSGPDGAFRPDMIVRMPDSRDIVVDVKTPLDAYLEAIEASNDQDRKLALQRHARKVSERIKELATKSYWSQFKNSPEFVILFIPGDQFLSAALTERPDLIDEALRQKIILATPTSFVALLKAVAYGWRQVALAENAEQIRQLAEDLYARLSVFGDHMSKIGKQLGGSVDAYNKAVGSLERNVLPGARKFIELGISSKKELGELNQIDALTRSVEQTGEKTPKSTSLDDSTVKPDDIKLD